MIAVLLGKAGYGINNLYQSPINLITSLTNMGLNFSATRDIAPVYAKGDMHTFSIIVKTLQKWMWITGLLGVVVTIALAPILSRSSFDDSSHTWTFVCLSAVLLLMTFNWGQVAILQGARKHKEYAKSIMLSSLVGLIIVVPLYYFWGNDGIAPALILSAIVTTFFSWYYVRKIPVLPVTVTEKELFEKGKVMIKFGIMYNMGTLVSQLTYYLTLLFIAGQSGEDQVGLFSSGWSITNQYVGLIFAAMTVDYFPKLATLQDDVGKMKNAVNEQGEIAILIVVPLIILYMTFMPIVIQLLLSSEFMPIVAYSRWLTMGMIIKTASWALGYVTLAKGDTKRFFFLEIFGNAIILAGSIVGYYFGSLEGIGIGIVSGFLINYLVITIYVKLKYRIFFAKEFQKVFLIQLAVLVLAFVITCCLPAIWIYMLGSGLFLLSLLYSLRCLNERIGLKELFRNYLKNKKNH